MGREDGELKGEKDRRAEDERKEGELTLLSWSDILMLLLGERYTVERKMGGHAKRKGEDGWRSGGGKEVESRIHLPGVRHARDFPSLLFPRFVQVFHQSSPSL